MLDIHSHILPAVDDGARDLDESLKILELMQSQEITDVIATPHFYPAEDNLEDFRARINSAFGQLQKLSAKPGLPKVYRGSEMLYFRGIGISEDLSDFCLNGSSYLLLELTDSCINDALFEDIVNLQNSLGITPIIAHVERYFAAKKYKKLIKFLSEQSIPVQINAESVLMPVFDRVIKKLFASSLTCILATDSHSADLRPPHMAQALEYVSNIYGEQYRTRLMQASDKFYKKIILGGE